MSQKQRILTFFIAFSVVVLSALSSSLAGSGPNMKDGLWEITTKVEMPGMPMSIPAMKHTQCITQENAVPESSQPDQECQITDQKVVGDTVTWSMECDTPEGKSTATGNINYDGDTFEGTIKMKIEGMEMIQNLNGQRIGDCNN